jgi:hypothetical protein
MKRNLALAFIGLFLCVLVGTWIVRRLPPAVIQPALPPSITPANMPPVVFVMLDSRNLDYQKLYPQYGALGGYAKFYWDDLNPNRGVYTWGRIDDFLRAAAAMTVTLDSGQVISKPVGIVVATWENLTVGGTIGVNHTPSWVGVMGSCGDPDGAGPCLRYCTPAWQNSTWRASFDTFVMALGAHYNKGWSNLAFVGISTGVDDETAEKKNQGGCIYTTGNSNAFNQWVNQVMATYGQAFPNMPTFLQDTLHGTESHAQIALTQPSQMLGVKVNGLERDVQGAEITNNGILVGGVTGFSQVYHDAFPTAFELRHGEDYRSVYWALMQGLAAHPHAMDLQLPNIEAAYQTEVKIGFPLLSFIREHLGKTAATAPDAWIILAGTAQTEECYTSSLGIKKCYGPTKANYGYFMRQTNVAATEVLQAEKLAQIPQPARSHVYGFQSARRGTVFEFELDADMAARSQMWEVTAEIVKGEGDVRINERGVSSTIPMATVGSWCDYTAIVTSPRFTLTANAPIIVHRVTARPSGGVLPTSVPTLPSSPTATERPTATPTTPMVTRSPTATPSLTPTPSAGKALCSRCAVGSSPCAPGLVCYDCNVDGFRCVPANSPNGGCTNCRNAITPSPSATASPTGTRTPTSTPAPTLSCCEILATLQAPTPRPLLTGLATYYNGPTNITNSGGEFDPEKMACAIDISLFSQFVNRVFFVRAIKSGRTVMVMVNDSGYLYNAKQFCYSYSHGYWLPCDRGANVVIDLTPGAFRKLSPDGETVEVEAWPVNQP